MSFFKFTAKKALKRSKQAGTKLSQIVQAIKYAATLGSTNYTYVLGPVEDPQPLLEELRSLGYRADMYHDSIVIQWGE